MSNPAEAVRRAKYAADITANMNPGILDILAAAYASRGQFYRARTIAEKALVLASDSKNNELSNLIRLRLELYKQSTMYLEVPDVKNVR